MIAFAGNEQLNRDFTLVLRGGAFLLLASSIAGRREGAGRAADGGAAVAAGAEAPAVAPTAPADGGLLQQAAAARDNAPAAAAGPVSAADWGYAANQPPDPAGEAPGGLQASRSASADLCEAVTFHVVGWQGLRVDLHRCMKVDERRFARDYFDLTANACASLYDNVLALTSTHKQAIHLLYVNTDGTLTDIQCIGRYCQADDHLPRVVEQRPTEVAPTLRDFQYNFGVLSSLVVYRARLLDRQHLLLKLGAPTTGPAAAAELNPSRVHFFAVYDLHSTLVKGFWRASSAKLLNCFMADPQELLAAGTDMSPWESKHISPIMGLRNSPAEPLRFRLARSYMPLQRGTEQAAAARGGQGAVDEDATGKQQFCFQCGSFQPVGQFTGERRSCEAALQAHNARRRVNRDVPAQEVSSGRRIRKPKRPLVQEEPAAPAAQVAAALKASRSGVQKAPSQRAASTASPAAGSSGIGDAFGAWRRGGLLQEWSSFTSYKTSAVDGNGAGDDASVLAAEAGAEPYPATCGRPQLVSVWPSCAVARPPVLQADTAAAGDVVGSQLSLQLEVACPPAQAQQPPQLKYWVTRRGCFMEASVVSSHAGLAAGQNVSAGQGCVNRLLVEDHTMQQHQVEVAVDVPDQLPGLLLLHAGYEVKSIGSHLLKFALSSRMLATASYTSCILRKAAGSSGQASKTKAKELDTWLEYNSKPEASESAAVTGGITTPAAGSAADAAQAAVAPSPLHAVYAALQVMAMLSLMYILLDMTAAVVKGRQPLKELLRVVQSIGAMFKVMLAPLCMMLVGWVIAMAQYGLLDWQRQQRGAAAAAGAHGRPAAAQYDM
eukprot:gene11574-11718_t